MNDDERKHVFSMAVDQAKGRIPIVAGTSATKTSDVIELTKGALAVGCAGAMVLPPIYIEVDDNELVDFYTRVANETGLPIMLYNSPFAVRNHLKPQVVSKLMEIENVVAIKDSSYDLRQMNDLIRFCGNELQVFIGLEDLMLSALAVGAVGAVSMVPQVVGRIAVELYEAAAAGDFERAREIHYKIVRIYDLFKIGSSYIAVKESMNLLGKPGGYTRPPMKMFNASQKAELRNIFEDVGML